MLKFVCILIISFGMAGFIRCQAQNGRMKVEKYDGVSFYLVYPDTMKNMLAEGIEDDCRDSVLIFLLYLTFKPDSTIANDSVYYLCKGRRIHSGKLSSGLKKIKFTCEDIENAGGDYSFTLPVRIRTRLVIGH